MSKLNDLSLTVVAAEVNREPTNYTLKATEAQRAGLVTRFGLVTLDELAATVKLYARNQGQGLMVEGAVKAVLTQRCSATLKDVPETVDAPFTLWLVDPETANRMDQDESFMEADGPEYDALEGDVVDLGEIVAQTVAISMNPYPRAEGAALNVEKNKDISVNEPELERKNPFAVLGALKDES
ncbi:MAG: DUF177 domain-containing protein [Kordiimonadaceae bacterium]|nr:DUF177 domain-containing protein [Kordiimonadaceae bacterium]